MKIATRIGVGYAILISLIVAALSYQVSRIHQMETINRDLSGINFRAAIICLQMLRDLDQVEEFTRKFFVTEGDPGYASRVEEMREAFSQELRELKSLRLSRQEEEEIRQLARLWSGYLEASPPRERPFRSQRPQQLDAALARQLVLCSGLRMQTQSVIRTTRLAIEAQVKESARTGQRAERISLAAAIAALVLSLLVSLWIVRSISRPLRRLTEGTCAVAEGKFSHRLEVAGNDELAQLARDFDTMTRRLSELDEMKKDFVSHVSHELKSPLASLHETNRLLLEQIPGPLTERQRQLLEVNLRSCRRLSLLIENLLDLARLEAGVMQYEIGKHDLAALLRTVLAEFEAQMWEKGFQMEAQLPEQPVVVECDGDRIVQVMNNLLGNAVKFSPSGSAIQVCLSHLEKIPAEVPEAWRPKAPVPASGGGFALICVADSGPGVPATERESIFEKFHRAQRTKRIAGGAGLGLAISRSIVEAHHGAIWVGDNPRGGSIFYVLLPARAVSGQTAARVPSFFSGLA